MFKSIPQGDAIFMKVSGYFHLVINDCVNFPLEFLISYLFRNYL